MIKNKYIIFFICLLCIACRKENPVNEDDCLNFYNRPATVNFLNWPGIDTTYNTPCFNPNNSNEIIYIKGCMSANKGFIVKRNLVTGYETYIVSDVWGKPDWSSKDWIVFNHADNQVWKIKSNGDSLQQLSTQGGMEGIWNHSGDKIAYWNQIQSTYFTFITDENGNHLDTLLYPFLLHNGAWSYDNNKIASYTYTYDVGYIDLISKELYKITNNKEDSRGWFVISDMVWTSDSQNIIWCNGFGIFKTNIISHQTIQIITACDSKQYRSVSVSSDAKKIIAGRADQKLVDNNLYIKSGLSIMDIDGKNEVKIK